MVLTPKLLYHNIMNLNTIESIIPFIERNEYFILTTHDPPDADGLGAQMILFEVISKKGKKCRIINASPIPEHFKFIDPQEITELWDEENHGHLPWQAAAIMVDTSDLNNIGRMKEPVSRCMEVFIIDHHELGSDPQFKGICDPQAASTSELAVEIAEKTGISPSSQAAFAAYTGIAYDTGFFAFPKTNQRTLHAALLLLKCGIKPNKAYKCLYENSTTRVLQLQKKVISSLSFHSDGRIAVQTARLEDFEETGTQSEDTNGFVNFPLKSRETLVSIMLKEMPGGNVKCSLRSKDDIDISKLAQDFGGGGHINASGFKTDIGIEEILKIILIKITKLLEDK